MISSASSSLRPLEQEVLAPDQLAAADEEDLDAGVAVRAREGDHVLVLPWPRRSRAAARSPSRPPGSGRGVRRPLELEALGRLLHAPAQRRHDLLVLALEEQADLGDDLRGTSSASAAPMHGPRQRWMWYSRHGRGAFPSDRRWGRSGTGRAGEAGSSTVDAEAERIRAEVAAAVADDPARPLDPRPVVAERDLDVRVVLVVASRTLYFGRCCLMRLHSRTSASSSESVRITSTSATRSMTAADPVDLARGPPASASSSRTRLRRLWALPTYRTSPRASFMRYTPGRSGSRLRVASSSGVTLRC